MAAAGCSPSLRGTDRRSWSGVVFFGAGGHSRSPVGPHTGHFGTLDNCDAVPSEAEPGSHLLLNRRRDCCDSHHIPDHLYSTCRRTGKQDPGTHRSAVQPRRS